MFSGSANNERYISIQATDAKKMSTSDLIQLAALPSTCLVPSSLLSFVLAYRVHVYQTLYKKQQELLESPPDLVLSQFGRLYSNPDIVALLAEMWPHLHQGFIVEKK